MTDIDWIGTPESPTLAHIDLDALEGGLLSDGTPLPPSYRALIRTVGWGRLFGLWFIYPPVLPGFADGRPGRTLRLGERFQAWYADSRAEDYDWVIEPNGSWELIERLEVFGWSENGDFLLWELGARDARGELPVWESRGLGSLHRLGGSLAEALPGLCARAGADRDDPASLFQPLTAHRIDSTH
ncbi:hypothetical protein D9V32_07645 [Mycetocola tolaasinivorans]|uniref:SMI1/KNR4 family protein n=1 Tax=Mycetocola tolaasinivorans TaxID=76635 RepID=A0A3L7A8W0_9MICO|nr:SMI1/KNR4 family protein [Mycetocola tolaasinivorans]RLP76021.1 hypothetical protein D9V32_07645 [Mycetocola tolaasinivorans]